MPDKTNQYPGKCFVCGSIVNLGEGVMSKAPAYQDDMGYWHSGGWQVRHAKPCQVRIRIILDENARFVDVQVDTGAFVLIDQAQNSPSVWVYPTKLMHAGEALSFDLALHRLQEEKHG